MTRYLLMTGLAVAVGSTLHAGEMKLGVVDIGRALRAHPDSKEADAVLEKQIAELEAHRDSVMAEQEKMKKAFEAARDEALNKTLSEAGRDERMGVAQQKLAELTEFAQKARQAAMDDRKELADRKARMQRRIVDKIRGIISEMAKSRGLDMVLDSSGIGMSGVETVLYSAETVDLTDAVIAAVSGGRTAAKDSEAAKDSAKAPEDVKK